MHEILNKFNFKQDTEGFIIMFYTLLDDVDYQVTQYETYESVSFKVSKGNDLNYELIINRFIADGAEEVTLVKLDGNKEILEELK